jgi:hypothetical protein
MYTLKNKKKMESGPCQPLQQNSTVKAIGIKITKMHVPHIKDSGLKREQRGS